MQFHLQRSKGLDTLPRKITTRGNHAKEGKLKPEGQDAQCCMCSWFKYHGAPAWVRRRSCDYVRVTNFTIAVWRAPVQWPLKSWRHSPLTRKTSRVGRTIASPKAAHTSTNWAVPLPAGADHRSNMSQEQRGTRKSCRVGMSGA